jgi:two-component system, cell cycle sensor histidine kinase and response regulator CckA
MKTIREAGELLRSRAEDVLRSSKYAASPVPSELSALVHELQVHEVELQMQNEALREAQHELEVSRERYRELYELAPVAYFSLDRDARITEANAAAGVLLGVETAALAHQPLTKFIVPERAETFERHRREVMASETRCSCMLELITADRQQREVRVESLRSSRLGTSWRCMMMDVTDVHRLQRRLHQAQKLQAISALASGVAHEFNNVLMGMIGCAEMALAKIDPNAPGRAPVEQLKEVAVRGRSVVGQLLSFGRRESPHLDVIDLNAVVNTSRALLRQRLGGDVALELKLEPGGAFVRGDAGQLEQILLNLAGNARDAMPEGGCLRIETRSVASAELPPDARAALGERRCIALKVIDTGVGMDAETQARALEPFFTTKPPGQGTGLGLAMVHAAIRDAGGHLELRSRVGSGTAVELYWPEAAPSAAKGEIRDRPSSPPPRVASVLVVDDNDLVRMSLRHYLQRAGYEAVEAASGEDALALLRTKRGADVQLIVTDMVLPGMQGVELAAMARKVKPGLGVLFVSAHAPGLLVERGWVDPGVCVLQKPFTAEELQEAVAATFAELTPTPER